MSDDDIPLPTVEQEVADNQYDWSDPERNEYDSDDSFLAPEGDDEEGGTALDLDRDDEGEEVLLLSPQSLARAEQHGRPRRTRRRPIRYSPPIDDESEERYTYECVGVDDDGDDEQGAAREDDDSSVYNPVLGGSSSSEEDEDSEGGKPNASSPRGVKRPVPVPGDDGDDDDDQPS